MVKEAISEVLFVCNIKLLHFSVVLILQNTMSQTQSWHYHENQAVVQTYPALHYTPFQVALWQTSKEFYKTQ